MRTVFAAVLVLSGGVAWSADDDAAKAKATVEKAVKAAGWEKQPANKTWSEKGVFHFGGQKIEYTADWWHGGPDKLRFDFKGKLMGGDLDLSAATGGTKSWQALGDKSEEMPAEKATYTQGQAYLLWVYSLTPLLEDKAFTLKPAAGIKVDGQETVGVSVSRKDRPTVTLYFDAGTGLPAKAEATVKNEFDGWKEVSDETYFSGWKEGEGKRKVPVKLKVVRGGETMIECEQSGHKWPDKIEAKVFDGK